MLLNLKLSSTEDRGVVPWSSGQRIGKTTDRMWEQRRVVDMDTSGSRHTCWPVFWSGLNSFSGQKSPASFCRGGGWCGQGWWTLTTIFTRYFHMYHFASFLTL